MTKKHSKKETDNLKEIEELKKGWQRTQADFDNFVKRVEGEKLENLAQAKAEFMVKISPVLDNFYRAFANTKKDDPIVSGFLQIKKQLEDILADEGLKKISTQKGTKFDPNLHEAISYEENDLPTDTIIDELESGWQFEDRVVKPAKVRVSKGK